MPTEEGICGEELLMDARRCESFTSHVLPGGRVLS
jgi:hypothetical protein